MFIYGIAVKSGFHISGKRVFMMRFVTYKDKLPKCWKNRKKTIKKLMKSPKWNGILESRPVSNITWA